MVFLDNEQVDHTCIMRAGFSVPLTPHSILAWSKWPIDVVSVSIDNILLGNAIPAKSDKASQPVASPAPLFVLPWNASEYSTGSVHTIMVHVRVSTFCFDALFSFSSSCAKPAVSFLFSECAIDLYEQLIWTHYVPMYTLCLSRSDSEHFDKANTVRPDCRHYGIPSWCGVTRCALYDGLSQAVDSVMSEELIDKELAK